MKYNKKKSLSIVIPTWNRKKRIYRLLISLVNILNNNTPIIFEIIVIDSHSNDNTKYAIKNLMPYIGKNKLSIFQSNFNSIAMKRNIGILKSKYNNVLLLDDDCVLDGNNIIKAIQYLESNNINKKNVFCGQYYTRQNWIKNSNYYYCRNLINLKTNKNREIDFKNIITGFCFFNKSRIIKKQILFNSEIKGYGIEDIAWAKKLQLNKFKIILTKSFCWHDETSSNIYKYCLKWYFMGRDTYPAINNSTKKMINLESFNLAEKINNNLISRIFFKLIFLIKIHAIVKIFLGLTDSIKLLRSLVIFRLILKLYFLKGFFDKDKLDLNSNWYKRGYK